MLHMPTRNESLLDFLLTNQENLFVISRLVIALVAVITILRSLGSCWAHWRLALRQRFWIVEEQTSALSELSWGGFRGKLPCRRKELVSAGNFSRRPCWNPRNSSSPLKVREVGRARDLLGLTASFWLCSKLKEKHIRDVKANKYPLRTTRAL